MTAQNLKKVKINNVASTTSSMAQKTLLSGERGASPARRRPNTTNTILSAK